MTENKRDLERSLDATRNGSPDARRVLLNRLAYATIREMEREIRKRNLSATPPAPVQE